MIIVINLFVILFDAILVNLPYDFVFAFAPKPRFYGLKGPEYFIQFMREREEYWKEHKLKNFFQCVLSHLLVLNLMYFFINKIGG